LASSVRILLKRLAGADAYNKRAEKLMNELRNKGLLEVSHISDTNVLTLKFKSRYELESILPKIRKIRDISLYYTQPDYLKEVSDAIEYHEFFKAFTLCNSLYESFGKNILIIHIKEHLSLKSKHLEKLGIQGVILLLYTHGLIKEGTYSDMLSVNSVRNHLTHRFLPSIMSEEILKEINENIPKIMRSLTKLNEINAELEKIKDACRELGDYMTDNALRKELMGYSDAFMSPSDVILNSDMPRNEQQRESLLSLLDSQLSQIEKFLSGFEKELEQQPDHK